MVHSTQKSSNNRRQLTTSNTDPGNGKVWATAPDNVAEDTDAAVKAAHEAFQTYRKVNPRTRAQCLLKWDQLIRDNRDDLANIVTYETGKPLFESQGELDYALGFTWWFAGEAERVHGTVQTPAAPNRRVFTVKQPIGVAVALVPWNFPIASTCKFSRHRYMATNSP
jgi:acyl-CoA reductase-like NAD-dependent aldehyde dehydrogenase